MAGSPGFTRSVREPKVGRVEQALRAGTHVVNGGARGAVVAPEKLILVAGSPGFACSVREPKVDRGEQEPRAGTHAVKGSGGGAVVPPEVYIEAAH